MHGKAQASGRVVRQISPINSRLKLMMEALNVSCVHNSKNGTKITIITTKLVLRTVSLESLMEAIMHITSDNDASLLGKAGKRQKDFPSISVNVAKLNCAERIVWNREDVSLFDGSNVRVEQLTFLERRESGSSQMVSGHNEDRQPDFGGDDFSAFCWVLKRCP